MLNIAQACPASIPWPSQLGQVESYNHLSLYYSLLALSIYSQFIIFQPKIKIMAQNFQDMILGVYQVHPHHHGWPSRPGLLSGTINILQVPPSWPPIPVILLRKILAWNFQGILLRDKQDHPWHQEWPCPPSLWSGTLNILKVPTFLILPSWQNINKYIDTKLSGYLL